MYKTENITVIIPCYEPSGKNFIPYVEELLKNGIQNIVVVNDGSGEKYANVFEKLKELDKNKIHLIEYSENKGKGYALKTAMSYCKESFDITELFLTADCDGQHRVADVLKVGEYVKEHPEALTLGVRDFSSPNVPARSRSGNEKMKAMFSFFHGIKLSDTQTGLRGFSYSLLDELIAVSGDRFEYETNQLVCIHRKHIGIREVTIETVYEEKAEDVDRRSHFRTFSDSVKVVAVMLKNLGWYFLSSALSAVIDVALFAVLFVLVLKTPSVTLNTLIATVAARVISSVVNFICNYKLVFHGTEKSSIFRYYTLWFFQLCASFGLAGLWANITEIKLLVSALKGISDILLALVSYQVQSRWVFAEKNKEHRFYGGFARFAKGALNLLCKKYKTEDVHIPDEGCVYVCRHLNMHGPYTVPRSLPFDVHVMVFSAFFTFKDAFRHYSAVTFAKDGRATLSSKLKAFVPSVFLPLLFRSAKAIPVYRNSVNSLLTLKRADKCLMNNECVLVFPDVDYKASCEVESDIYKGFLLLEKNYFKNKGEHLKFVPIYIDDKEKKIYANTPVCFEDGDFRSQIDSVAERLKLSFKSADRYNTSLQ